MKRVIEKEMETKCKKAETAIKRFFEKNPDLLYWKETFEYMAENNESFFSDYYIDTYNRVRNENWVYALHFVENDDYFYLCVIERA